MKTNMFFSFSIIAVSLASLGGGAMFLESNKGKINQEPSPTLLPHPAPVDAAPPTLELPDTTVSAVTLPTPKVVKVPRSAFKAKIAVLPEREKVMVCGSNWQDSNYGGQYRVCEMK